MELFSSIGRLFSRFLEWAWLVRKDARIVFLGLDNAGKSTLLYMLQTNRYMTMDSTIFAHQAEVTIGNIRFNTYDLGGHPQARKTWKDYGADMDGVVYLVDAADKNRLKESKEELDALLKMEELMETPFVIFGNKVDKPGSMNEVELRQAL